MDESGGSHRTRSKAAPDWTVEESLALVNEIDAVESEWGGTLPSFQKWQQIVVNCYALGVNRNLNQCKRQWDALLAEYRLIRNGTGANQSFPVDLFEAIDGCVNASAKKNDGGGEVEAAVEPAFMDTDPDSDTEEQVQVTEFLRETGSKKQRRRMKRKKPRVQRLNPWGYFTSPNINHEEPNSTTEKKIGIPSKNFAKSVSEEITVENEQEMAAILWQNALQINAILEGDLGNEVGCKLANLKNDETDFTRRQGDKLIDCLERISTTLNQICDSVQQSN